MSKFSNMKLALDGGPGSGPQPGGGSKEHNPERDRAVKEANILQERADKVGSWLKLSQAATRLGDAAARSTSRRKKS